MQVLFPRCCGLDVAMRELRDKSRRYHSMTSSISRCRIKLYRSELSRAASALLSNAKGNTEDEEGPP
jgi:hypothetical protein